MRKGSKPEDEKLTIEIPDTEPTLSSSDVKSPLVSPRVTRKTAAALAITMSELELNILFKFIKPYDGSRETLNSFLVNCDNAFGLASDAQKSILFKFILSQLHGKAEIACSIKEFTSWDQLKEFLKTQFSERKHYSHLLTELQENKQGPQDTVSQYALRTETCLSQLLTEISLSNIKAKELAGRTAAMEDLALHHFVMGLHPRISNIIRCKSPKSLNEAINYAISEERIQQTLYRRPQSDQKPNNNNTNNRFRAGPSKPNQNSSFSSQRPSNPSSQGASNVVCRYCKIPGHDISVCRKREYNNNRFKVHQNPTHNTHQSPRVNFLEQPEEEDGHDEATSLVEPLNE
ncbi:uncharacterized protein LOC114355181 [Ostrinia furnacalis]|uniref:uncharacterized protein LOC114355181 n=1 Tax=Ostrinia furnacalis TaxID=93504 RepID=UPI0010396D7C|nr:uncharacterized protein LOC114355181 [Ostrinia furnacalis]